MTILRSSARGSQRRRQRAASPSARSGFTLIELMVAIVILVVGVLGLAGTAGMVSRLVGGAGQQTVAASIASSRFEKLRSVPCGQLVSGTATTRHMTETWTVTASAYSNMLWNVRDVVTYNAAGGRTPQLSFESFIRCE